MNFETTIILHGTILAPGTSKHFADFIVTRGPVSDRGTLSSLKVIGPNKAAVDAEVKVQRAALKEQGARMTRTIADDFDCSLEHSPVSHRITIGLDALDDRRE